MKLFLRLILIGTLTYFLSPLSVWWITICITFVIGYLSPSSALNSFVSGFLGVGLVWMGCAWNLNNHNESVFAMKIATIMQIGDPIFLVYATGLIGGLTGGFSTLSGTYFNQLFIKKKVQRKYY